MFDSDDNVVDTRKDLLWLLEALVQRDQDYLARRPDAPRLYKSGVKWVAPKQYAECEEVQILRDALGSKSRQKDVARVLNLVQAVLGGEHFCDYGVILELGGIDCDGLAAVRAAEWRQCGVPARVTMTNRRQGLGTVYHALVCLPPMPGVPYVTSEDPSLLLGMGGEKRKADRDEEIRKNEERCEYLRGWTPERLAAFYAQRGVPTLFDNSLLAPPLDDLSSVVEDVLGLRRSSAAQPQPDKAVIAAIEDACRRIAA